MRLRLQTLLWRSSKTKHVGWQTEISKSMISSLRVHLVDLKISRQVSDTCPVTSALPRHGYKMQNGSEIGYLARDLGEINEREVNLALRHATKWRPSVDMDYKRVSYEAHNELSRVWHDQLHLPSGALLPPNDTGLKMQDRLRVICHLAAFLGTELGNDIVFHVMATVNNIWSEYSSPLGYNTVESGMQKQTFRSNTLSSSPTVYYTLLGE